ncbi:imm11 family protein [Cohnella terricola]|uniref:Immunity MXAN-0049 protein domain-containing protein n=1 Tax=Cohnella terricola TaxID=1289167 RepID=A0A559JQA9_9BACL|nr:DUF1629 domain-containing protein [Cohnella terricola]TVY02065.1 hypothetical protein FPZ45_06380 [Cohnella terricola]
MGKLVASNNNEIWQLSISSDYPDKYWIKYDSSSNIDYSMFEEGKRIDQIADIPEFSITGKFNEEKFCEFDYLISGNGPKIVSPKFSKLIMTNFSSDIQLIGAKLRVNGKELTGYHVINITNRISCMDPELSEYKPLLSYLPNGSIKITKLVISKNKLTTSNIFRLAEDDTIILVSSTFVQECDNAGIRGISFKEVTVN